MAERDRQIESIQDAIEAFAAERAPELVAEARAEAFARARSALADAMTDALLAHGSSELGSRRSASRKPRAPRGQRPRRAKPPARPAAAPPDQPAKRRPARAEGHDLARYVYGVVASRDADLPRGIAGVDPRHDVTLILDEDLAALVSSVPLDEFGEEELRENLNDLEWLEAKARAHEAVLESALSRMTVVPMRMCTIYRSEAQVREMLARERVVLRDALDRLEGRTEWGVKLLCEPGALIRAASSEDDGAAGEGDSAGAAYMQRKRREARARDEEDRVAEEWALEVHERIAPLASEAKRNPSQSREVSGHTGEMLLNGVYLVEDSQAERLREEVEALAAEFESRGAHVELTGPWPPYNFVQEPFEAMR